MSGLPLSLGRRIDAPCEIAHDDADGFAGLGQGQSVASPERYPMLSSISRVLCEKSLTAARCYTHAEAALFVNVSFI
jgi:hypothetical protein